MNFKKFSSEAVAELLLYLADNEEFKSLKGLKAFNSTDVRELFQEMADNLHKHSLEQPLMAKEALNSKDLSANLNRVMSDLSPHEENLLFKSFRIS